MHSIDSQAAALVSPLLSLAVRPAAADKAGADFQSIDPCYGATREGNITRDLHSVPSVDECPCVYSAEWK